MEKNNTITLPIWGLVILGSIGIGAIITTIVTCICGGFDESVRRIIVWLIASALFGIASLLIFGKDRLSLPVATALHAAICFAITIASVALCRYDGGLGGNILIIAIVFVVVYVVIYIIMYAISKSEERKINQKLSKSCG